MMTNTKDGLCIRDWDCITGGSCKHLIEAAGYGSKRHTQLEEWYQTTSRMHHGWQKKKEEEIRRVWENEKRVINGNKFRFLSWLLFFSRHSFQVVLEINLSCLHSEMRRMLCISCQETTTRESLPWILRRQECLEEPGVPFLRILSTVLTTVRKSIRRKKRNTRRKKSPKMKKNEQNKWKGHHNEDRSSNRQKGKAKKKISCSTSRGTKEVMVCRFFFFRRTLSGLTLQDYSWPQNSHEHEIGYWRRLFVSWMPRESWLHDSSLETWDAQRNITTHVVIMPSKSGNDIEYLISLMLLTLGTSRRYCGRDIERHQIWTTTSYHHSCHGSATWISKRDSTVKDLLLLCPKTW